MKTHNSFIVTITPSYDSTKIKYSQIITSLAKNAYPCSDNC